jgi:SpoVK/Ycf46/Vps4 family AAA+-type ATPase
MMQPKDIQKVDLYFNPDFAKRIDRMSTILMPQKFAEFQASFPKNAKMKGLTMLFHGGPGSGKTETVLQLCRKTKRPLMKIEVTDFQSKWVGESERKLKQIFTDYKTACERMEVAPILFLNECDQIIGKRVGIRNSVDQMNNALQNILLEQLEQFQGIMIGTTNLTKNMDEAFERRFAMKFQFESPNETAKVSIWKSAIKGLRQQEAIALVKQFDFTPGEINNVARRFMVENLLGLEKSRLQTLQELCETEHYERNHTSNIGFSFDKSLSLKSKAV